MRHVLTKRILKQPGVIKGGILGVSITSPFKTTPLVFTGNGTVTSSKKFGSTKVGGIGFELFRFFNLRRISQHTLPEKLCWAGSSSAVLLKKLEVAMKNQRIGEAWEYFKDFKNVYGFPDDDVMDRLVVEMCYSSDSRWLQKACNLVLLISEKKSALLKCNVLTKLSISLARSQMPVPASMVLRLMLHRNNLPKLDILQLVFMHMGKTEIGACLSSNILIQICDNFLQMSQQRDQLNLMKPDTMIFNFVLDACVRFKLCLKGNQIIEFMPRMAVIADAHTIVLISQVHDMNGQRDELTKFKNYIDQVAARYTRHYGQFYDKLLSLHFKFDDIDSVSKLVFDMCSHEKSLPILKHEDSRKPNLIPIGPQNLKAALKIQIMPDLICQDSVLKDDEREEFVTYENGKLILSSLALAKLILGYKRLGKITELTKVLLHIQNMLTSREGSNLNFTVVNACIDLGWLETAHDILEDMESAGAQLEFASYMSLLKAYYKGQMYREANALLKQMRNNGVLKSMAEEEVVSACISEVATEKLSSTGRSNLAMFIVDEMKVSNKNSQRVFELNSSIYYFCKAKMMGDALKTYKKMKEMNIQPTVQTFFYLANGYYSLGMYRDIAILWGDIKRTMQSGDLVLSSDLCEFMLLSFIRGGYFERVMEISGYMEEHKIFTDKLMYKCEFLKLHKDLYRNLKTSQTRNEAQQKRLEFVQAFRKWVGAKRRECNM